MAHGTPDWGITAAKSTIYSLHDMGELAVRLGSPVSYDRRGDVIFLDTFDTGESKVAVEGSGDDNEIYPSCGDPVSAPMHLVFRTGPTAGDLSGFHKTLYYPVTGGIGVEIAFLPVADLRWFRVYMQVFDGTDYHWFHTYYDHTDGKIYVHDHTLGWTPIGTPGIVRVGAAIYSYIKLVGNLLTDDYVRVIFNDHTYDASDYSASVDTDATKKSMTIGCAAYTNVNAAILVPVDNLIVTQNEPVS